MMDNSSHQNRFFDDDEDLDARLREAASLLIDSFLAMDSIEVDDAEI